MIVSRLIAAGALAFGLGLSAADAPMFEVFSRSDAATLLPEDVPVPVAPLTLADIPKPWRQLAACESSGRQDATAGSRDQFQGYFQIEFPRTWEAHGGTTSPATAADLAEQWGVALHIYRDRGSAPWPHCGRFLREAYGR